MPDKAVPGPVGSNASIREAVSINTAKIFDCCRDKDCVDELRVYPTISSQAYIDNAISIRPKSAELLFVNVNVEPVGFNRGYYTVDCTYFYRVTAETFPGAQLCRGLAVFDKRVMLFGSEGSVKTLRPAEGRRQRGRSDLPALHARRRRRDAGQRKHHHPAVHPRRHGRGPCDRGQRAALVRHDRAVLDGAA